jgi:hypothetical protein
MHKRSSDMAPYRIVLVLLSAGLETVNYHFRACRINFRRPIIITEVFR